MQGNLTPVIHAQRVQASGHTILTLEDIIWTFVIDFKGI